MQQDQKDSKQQIAGTGQGGLTLPDRDYYLDRRRPRSKKLRDQYVEHVTKMFVLLGDTPEQAAEEAADVMWIETALAKGSMARVEMRDPAKRYHIMTVAELQAADARTTTGSLPERHRLRVGADPECLARRVFSRR